MGSKVAKNYISMALNESERGLMTEHEEPLLSEVVELTGNDNDLESQQRPRRASLRASNWGSLLGS